MKRAIVFGLAAGAVGLNLLRLRQARSAERRYPPVGQFVEAAGGRLHYVRQGSGPPVVLLHGSDGFLQDFPAALRDRLALDYEVIALDRPGHGYSEPCEDTLPTPGAQAEIIRSALRQLGVEKPLLVGHSWSGALLLAYALQFPEEAAGLVLLAPWAYPTEAPAPLLLLPQVPVLGPLLTATLLPVLKRPILRSQIEKAFRPDAAPPGYLREALALWQRWPRQTQAFAQENTAALPALRQNALRYPEIRLPVVILTGDSDRTVDAEQQAARLHAEIPQSVLTVLPQTGHELPQTRPDAVIEAVRLCRGQAEMPAENRKPPPDPRSRESGEKRAAYARARELALRYGWNATAYQILNPAMRHAFAPEGDAVIGYVSCFRVRVVAGAPVCPEERLSEVVRAFEREARQAGERVCYFGAASRLFHLLHALPSHSALVIGAQPVWDPVRWPEMLRRHASLRAQLNRARNKGVEVAEWAQERAGGDPDLQRCLQEWLASHPLPALHFLTEPVTPDRLADRRIFVAEANGVPVGFLIAAPVPDRNGWLIEQIARGNHAPNGASERMIDAAMQAFGQEGFRYVTLGLAPLSQRAPLPQQSHRPWLRLILAWIRAHGRRFYNFEGLDAFKAKFRPDSWEPIYAISNEARFSLSTLYAIAAAFSGSAPARVILRAMRSALRQELRWLQERAGPPR